jgi:hypothetical protein
MLDIEEYRLLSGWSRDRKHGSDRYDRIPVSFGCEYRIDEIRDYLQFIPPELDDGFTSADFARAAGISRETCRCNAEYTLFYRKCDKNGKKRPLVGYTNIFQEILREK